MSRAVYTPCHNNVVPTIIPSFLPCNLDPSLFGCKNCVWPEEDGDGQPAADSHKQETGVIGLWMGWQVHM